MVCSLLLHNVHPAVIVHNMYCPAWKPATRGGGPQPIPYTCVDFLTHTQYSSIAGNRKNGFISLPRSQNNCLKTCAFGKPCISHKGPADSCETQQGLLNVLYWPLVSFPSTHFYLSDMWRELYIPSPEEQFQCHCHLPFDILLLTTSLSSLSTISTPFFVLLWERIRWPFSGCHHACFLTRSLGFLESFSNSPLSVFGHLSLGPASHLAITRTI
jgi:hypothetical protein